MTDSGKRALSVTLPRNVRDLLDEIAEERNLQRRIDGDWRKVFAGDIVREALEEYLQRHGYDVSVDVNRGGFRDRKED